MVLSGGYTQFLWTTCYILSNGFALRIIAMIAVYLEIIELDMMELLTTRIFIRIPTAGVPVQLILSNQITGGFALRTPSAAAMLVWSARVATSATTTTVCTIPTASLSVHQWHWRRTQGGFFW